MATAGAEGERRSAMDGQPQDVGPENRQLFPSPVGANGRSVDVADGWARNGSDGRVFHVARQGEAFHALSRRVCMHTISILDGILRHSGLSRALFQVLPVPEFYFRSNTRDRKWNANKSVSLAPAIMTLQCRLRASSRDFASVVSKMAAKTTSGSSSDSKFGLLASGFLRTNVSRRLSAKISAKITEL